MPLKAPLKFLLLLGLAVVLGGGFGAIPMRVVWRSFGRLPYWIGHLAVTAALVAGGWSSYSLVFFVQAVLVGVYSDVEEHGSSVFNSGFVATLAAIGSLAVGIGAWLYQTKSSLMSELSAQATQMVDQVNIMNTGMQVTAADVLKFMPAGILTLMMVALALALIWERSILTWLRLPQTGVLLSGRLLGFRVPDMAVWIVILAILGAFLDHGHVWLEVLSKNALWVLAVLYFFQGLAVVAATFQAFKVSPFWQAIWYALMVVLQLFPFVSFLGFADYWLEFRQKMSRRPAEPNKGF